MDPATGSSRPELRIRQGTAVIDRARRLCCWCGSSSRRRRCGRCRAAASSRTKIPATGCVVSWPRSSASSSVDIGPHVWSRLHVIPMADRRSRRPARPDPPRAHATLRAATRRSAGSVSRRVRPRARWWTLDEVERRAAVRVAQARRPARSVRAEATGIPGAPAAGRGPADRADRHRSLRCSRFPQGPGHRRR